MVDIVERLKFDAARCEMQFSKGVARNIQEAAAEIERLTRLARELDQDLTYKRAEVERLLAIPATLRDRQFSIPSMESSQDERRGYLKALEDVDEVMRVVEQKEQRDSSGQSPPK